MQSAIELYSERGFEQTTAAEIAQRAGVTERTFFRYFADKREVLFNGSAELQRRVVTAIAEAPAEMAPLDVMSRAMQGAATLMQENRAWSRQRTAVIALNPGLQERELLKLARLASAAAVALRERGVPELAASLAAETGVTVFKIGFETWVGDDAHPDFARCIRDSLDQLRGMTSGV
ncbi:TetR family transcriptional regulator [Subtercola boreus]|nr:TetR family transcriptional regulator [Subtercola boreus]